MSLGTAPYPFEESLFCRTAAELDINEALLAIERTLASNEALSPRARIALERASEALRGESTPQRILR